MADPGAPSPDSVACLSFNQVGEIPTNPPNGGDSGITVPPTNPPTPPVDDDSPPPPPPPPGGGGVGPRSRATPAGGGSFGCVTFPTVECCFSPGLPEWRCETYDGSVECPTAANPVPSVNPALALCEEAGGEGVEDCEDNCEGPKGACCYSSGSDPTGEITFRYSRKQCQNNKTKKECDELGGLFFVDMTCKQAAESTVSDPPHASDPCPDPPWGPNPPGGGPGGPPGGGGYGGGSSPAAPSEQQAQYCSPLNVVVTEEKPNVLPPPTGGILTGSYPLQITTAYTCQGVDSYFNSTIHKFCKDGDCPSRTLESFTDPQNTQPREAFVNTSLDWKSVPHLRDIFEASSVTTEGLSLSFDTLPENIITAVLKGHPNKRVINRAPNIFSDNRLESMKRLPNSFDNYITDTGINIYTSTHPTNGGTVFVVEKVDGELVATAIVGNAHLIYLQLGNTFYPSQKIGKVLYGTGTIYYSIEGGLNLGAFSGGIETPNGTMIFSNPAFVYNKEGKQTQSIRSREHLKTMKVYDPTFIPMARSSRFFYGVPFSLSPRSATFQNPDELFSSWDDPGSGKSIPSYRFATPNYFTVSRQYEDPRFSFPFPSRKEAREMQKDFILYNNTNKKTRNIFPSKVHRGIAAISDILGNNLNNYRQQYFYDVSLQKIEKSLRQSIKKVITNVPELYGGLVNKDLILQGIYNLLFTNNVDKFDITYFMEYINRVADLPYLINQGGYSNVRGGTQTGTVSPSRFGGPIPTAPKLLPTTPVTPPHSLNAETAVAYAISNRRSLDFRNYGTDNVLKKSYENYTKMKSWWLLPQDINLSFTVNFPSGKDGYIWIKNDKSFQFTSPTGDSIKAPIDKNYQTIFYTEAGAKAITLELDYDDLKYCYTLNPENKRALFSALGESTVAEMVVRTNDSLKEFTSDLTSQLSTVYYLQIDPDSLVDQVSVVDKSKANLIKQTSITYNVKSFEQVSDTAAEYLWPNFVVNVYYGDPILDLLKSEEKATFTFKDFDLSFLGETDIRYPRRIPPIIYVVPTDKTEYCPFYGESTLVTLNSADNKLERRLGIGLHFDPSKHVPGLDVPQMFTKVYPQASRPTPDRFKFKYVLNANAFPETQYYKDRVQPTGRPITPIRTLYDIIKFLDSYFILSKGLTEYDVWSRAGALAFYGAREDTLINPIIIQQLFDGRRENMGTAFTGVRVFKNVNANKITNANSEYFSRSRIIEPKSDATPFEDLPTIDQGWVREKYINPGDIEPTAGTDGTATSPASQAPNKPGRRSWR